MRVIETKNLCKSFTLGDKNLEVLKNINISIDQGELVAIVGKSGSGKSTLMNILGCLDTPTSGQYYIDGMDVSDLSPNQLAHIRNRKIGFVFQQFNLLPDLTALENVALPQLYAGIKPRVAEQRARTLLERVDLADRLDHFPFQVSGGQQQRISIARALVNKPSLILADEPTGNLDTKTGEAIMEMFLRLNKVDGITIILVTHDDEVAAQADRIIKLIDGNIVEDTYLRPRNNKWHEQK